jgi:protein gp37
LRDLLSTKLRFAAHERHIWWGVSVEDKRYGLPRIPHLRAAPAAIRFLSIEPLLEDLGDFDMTGIDWAIVGGESGPRSRPMAEEWALELRDQCRAAKVAFFFKQWGGVRPKSGGRLLRGREWNQYPRITKAQSVGVLAAE